MARVPEKWLDAPISKNVIRQQVTDVVTPFVIHRFKSEEVPKVWPFHEVTPDQYDMLSAEEKEHVEKGILLRIRSRDSPAKQLSSAQG